MGRGRGAAAGKGKAGKGGQVTAAAVVVLAVLWVVIARLTVEALEPGRRPAVRAFITGGLLAAIGAVFAVMALEASAR